MKSKASAKRTSKKKAAPAPARKARAASNPRTVVVQEIRQRYGSIIDLRASPGVLIEILRNYGRLFQDDDGGGGGTSTVAVGITPGTGGGGGTGSGGTGTGGTGTGGVGGGTSTVAVGITPGEDIGDQVSSVLIFRSIQRLHRDVRALARALQSAKR